jgi:magnesium-transporting ATPase (P-type)
MNKRPISVLVIALLTLIIAVALSWFFGFVIVNVLIERVAFGFNASSTAWILLALGSVLLEAYAFMISIAMLRSDSKYVWYASILFWSLVIVTAVLDIFLTSTGPVGSDIIAGLSLSSVEWATLQALPFVIFSVIFLICYLFKENIKNYFNI